MKFKAVLVLAALASAINLANAADNTSIDVTYSTGDTSISVSKNSNTGPAAPVPPHHAPKPGDLDKHHPDFAHEPPHDGKVPAHPDGKESPHFDGKAPAHPEGKGPDFHAKDPKHGAPEVKKDLTKKDLAHDKNHDAHKASNQYKDLRRKG